MYLFFFIFYTKLFIVLFILLKMSGKEVKEILIKNGYSLTDIAKNMGESPQNLNSLLNAADIKTGVLEKIATAINNSLYFFFKEHSPVYKEKEPEKAVEDGLLFENKLLERQLKEKDAIIKDLNREIGMMTADNATLKKRINEISKHRDRAMAILESSELPNHNKSQLLIHLEGADRLLTEHLHNNR